MRSLRRLDVFPKFDRRFEHDARERTVAGALLSTISILVIATLIVSETRYYLSVEEKHEMYVDPKLGGDMLVQVNITFHRVPCDLITLDVVDAFGIFVQGIAEKTIKTRVDSTTLRPISQARGVVDRKKVVTRAVDANGAEKENCPSCYGAERESGDCCFTCTDVRMAYERKGWEFDADDISVEQCAEERLRLASAASSTEGCNIYAHFAAARVTGNMIFTPGRQYTALGRRLSELVDEAVRRLNLSHTIHHLDFGTHFPGQHNPLEGAVQVQKEYSSGQSAGRFSYFVKIIPTVYQTSSLSMHGTDETVHSNQYSVTHHFTPTVGITERVASRAQGRSSGTLMASPAVSIVYDLSPILIHIHRTHPYPSILHFLLQLCAVCGGVFTVAGLIDALLFHTARRIRRLHAGKEI